MKIQDQLTELIHEASKEGRNANNGHFIISHYHMKELQEDVYTTKSMLDGATSFRGVPIMLDSEAESPRLIFNSRY